MPLNPNLIIIAFIVTYQYLIEVKNTETAKVPKNWVKISGYV